MVGSVSATRAVFELHEQDELTLSAALVKLLAVQFNRDSGQQALMAGELACGDTDRPSDLGLPAFREPTLERNTRE